MPDLDHNSASQWRQLLRIAFDLLYQLHEKVGGYDFAWTFGGGTAMMIRVGHRHSSGCGPRFSRPLADKATLLAFSRRILTGCAIRQAICAFRFASLARNTPAARGSRQLCASASASGKSSRHLSQIDQGLLV